jgi:ABC-type glycerol-3-phosphate transport system permease component
MKSATTGSVSGCIVWIIAFGVISLCIIPISMVIGGISSPSNFAIRQTGAILCPDHTTPEVYSYATTTTDEFGNRQPSTAYELHCVDSHGEVIKVDPVGYSFLWTGIIAAAGLIVSGLLAFVFAAPAGILIGRLLNKNNKT